MPRSDNKTLALISAYALREAAHTAAPTVGEAAAANAEASEKICRLAADFAPAREIRDAQLAELDRRVTDPAHSGAATHAWFREKFGPLGRSSFYRYRSDVLAAKSGIAEAAELAASFSDLAETHGAASVFKAANQRAMQLVFSILMETSAEKLQGDVNLSRVTKLLAALSTLGKTHFSTELDEVKITEFKRKFELEAKAAAAKAAGRAAGGDLFDDETIDKISAAVFGGSA